MAIKFLDSIDLTGLELSNVLAQNLAGVPTTALGEGQFIFDSTTGVKALKYWNGTKWITLDGQGGVTSVTEGVGISIPGTTGAVTVNIDYKGVDNAILSATDAGGTALVGDDVIWYTDAKGVSIKHGNVADLPFTNTSGTVESVALSSDIAAFAVTGSPVTGSGTLKLDLSGGTAGQFLKQDGTWASVPGGYSSWELNVNTVKAADITDGATVDLIDGTGIDITATKSAVTIALDTTGVTAGSYTSADITVDAEGRITAASAGGSGTMTAFKVGADTGTATIIEDGDTLTVTGGEGIDTVVSTDEVTVTLDLTELSAPKAKPVGTDGLAGVYGNVQGIDTINNISLSLFAAASGDIDMGGNQVSKIAATPKATDDAASKAYVDLVASGSGALIFQGGYDAASNSPVLDDRAGATPIAVLKGWTYAVTSKGTFYGEEVEDGDLLIAEVDNAVSLAEWTVVQNNIGVATDTVLGIANFPTAGGLAVSAGAVSLAASGATAGTYGTAAKVGQVTIDAKGIVTAASEVDIKIGAGQVTSFCAEVESCVTKREHTEVIGGATAMDVVHNLGTNNVIVQVYENAAPFANVGVTIERKDVDTVTIKVAKTPAEKSLVCLITKIG